MTTKFKVGDDIWWLDTRCVNKPRIKFNVILEIEWEKYYSRYKYVIDDNTTHIWSSNTVVANTKEELINILYPPKIGAFDYNQLVYVVKCNNNDYHNRLSIDIAYVKEQCILSSEYYLAKDIHLTNVSSYYKVSIKSIYKSIESAKEAINIWLNNNDRIWLNNNDRI